MCKTYNENTVCLSYIQQGKVYREYCNVEFSQSYDLCVVGVGTAGAMAALAAASYGLNTAGIEKCKTIGGLNVNGGVFSYYYGSKNGLFKKIIEKCYALEQNGYIQSVIDKRIEDAVSPLSKSYVLNEAAKKLGCKMYLSTDVCGVYSINKKIIGIRCICDGKIINIAAKVFIDCTSTAVLARSFGCEMLAGRSYDNEKMPYSKAIGKTVNYVYKDFSNGWWHHDYTHLADKTENFRLDSVWSVFDMPHLDCSQQYTESLLSCSAAEPCIKDKVSRMYYLACVPGERETFHVRTKKVIALQDVVNGTKVKQPLFYTFAPLDCINPELGYEDFLFQDWKMCVSDMGFSMGIEKEVLIANDADNLLIAGKILGAEHNLAGGIRMKSDMEKCGEAAAAVAFCAIKGNTCLAEANSSKIQELLSKTKCFCEDDNKGFAELRVPLNTIRKPYLFPERGEDMKAAFESPNAGRALWKAIYMWNGEQRKILWQWMSNGSDYLKINCAYVLGACGDESGKEILVNFINKKERVAGYELDYRIYSRYIRALSVAARCGWQEITDTLEEILRCEALNIYPEEYIKFRYAVTSMCIRAFEKIYSQHTEMQRKIKSFLLRLTPPKDKTMQCIYADIPFLNKQKS